MREGIEGGANTGKQFFDFHAVIVTAIYYLSHGVDNTLLNKQNYRFNYNLFIAVTIEITFLTGITENLLITRR